MHIAQVVGGKVAQAGRSAVDVHAHLQDKCEAGSGFSGGECGVLWLQAHVHTATGSTATGCGPEPLLSTQQLELQHRLCCRTKRNNDMNCLTTNALSTCHSDSCILC
jgi:hypothetical protein